eukprot:s350_g11.t1
MALAWHGQSCLSLKSEDAEAFWKALLPTDRILSREYKQETTRASLRDSDSPMPRCRGEYSVLDICSSWSHYPENLKAKRVAITGMVEEEKEKLKPNCNLACALGDLGREPPCVPLLPDRYW